MNLSLLSGIEGILFLAVLNTATVSILVRGFEYVWHVSGVSVACMYVFCWVCQEGTSWVIESAHFCFSRHVRPYR